MLQRGEFQLKKRLCNPQTVLESIPEDDRSTSQEKVFEDLNLSSDSPTTERIRAWYRPMVFDLKKSYIELDNAVYDLDPSERDSVCIKIFSDASRVSFTSRLVYSVLEIASWVEANLRHEISQLL